MVYRTDDVEPDEGDVFTGTRQCLKCRNRLSMDEFYFTKTRRHRRRKCKTCVDGERVSRLEAINSDPVRSADRKAMIRWQRIKTRYGMTKEEFKVLLTTQDNCCGICGESFDVAQPHIDHCHDTGYVRGLLCGRCNRGLGQLGDSAARLTAAVKYLTDPPTQYKVAVD